MGAMNFSRNSPAKRERHNKMKHTKVYCSATYDGATCGSSGMTGHGINLGEIELHPTRHFHGSTKWVRGENYGRHVPLGEYDERMLYSGHSVLFRAAREHSLLYTNGRIGVATLNAYWRQKIEEGVAQKVPGTNMVTFQVPPLALRRSWRRRGCKGAMTNRLATRLANKIAKSKPWAQKPNPKPNLP